MSTSNKTPRKTPHKQRNILQQDDENLLDEKIIEIEPKIVIAQKNRRKSTISHRNIPDEPIEMISSDDDKKTTNQKELEKTPQKKSVKKLRHRTPSSKALENVAAEASPSFDLIEQKNTRRSVRVRSPRKRLVEEGASKPTKQTVRSTNLDSDSSSNKASDSNYFLDASSGNEEESKIIGTPFNIDFSSSLVDSSVSEDSVVVEQLEKPTTLFTDGNIDGQNLYGFKTPKKKDGMQALAAKTLKSTGTPKRQSLAGKLCPKTPHHLRVQTKKQLTKVQQRESESDGDFSSDDSDVYKPNSNTSEESEDEEKSQDEEKSPSPPVVLPQITSLRCSVRNRKEIVDYVPQSDDYFSHHSSKKLPTSNHTLDRLKNPRLQQNQLYSLLKELKLPAEHEKSIKELHLNYQSCYPKWIAILREGFNILLYGLGSKRKLLQHFHSTILSNENVLVVNGFFPSLTIKDILDDISEILELGSSRTPNDLLDLIEEKMLESSDECHLFLLIHNIDGVMLRNSKAQTILSRLATFDKIHLVCSIDHINTPLLWDKSKLGNFNFSWWDVTTLLPYTDETAFENSLLVQNSGNLALSSMKSVFQSLTKNTKGVYMLIVKQQMANKGQPNYQGMLFKDLYTKSRESFLCSSDLALRAQLTEFLDHRLVKTKRGADGSEYLNIPLPFALLQQFVEQQDAN